MACGKGEIEINGDETSNYDGIPFCVKVDGSSTNSDNTNAGSGNSGKGSSTWDKIMEAADKILQGAEIVTGYKNSKSTNTKRRGNFGTDVLNNNSNYPFDTNDLNSQSDAKKGINWVMVAGAVMALAFLFLLWKLFSTPKTVAPPVITAPPLSKVVRKLFYKHLNT